ncbi:ferredoxin [Streptococcus tangpeifui]|uniref:Ferredoxin, 4Fe-4S n=1 Tax=Streptococcus criceti HS-6 TaxID=873449 RepID=G5JTV5_STRCG|nr:MULTISPECIES: ferredoxin [Streptococcus]EHI74807.1 ferredoxin, 4Fe-4S [Streptococcus criceti HS-6]
MKVSIIPEKCIACGLCQTYSAAFDYHDDGIVKFADSNKLERMLPDTQANLLAVKSCPTKALRIDS